LKNAYRKGSRLSGFYYAGHDTILSGESILPLRSKMNLANKNPESLIIKDPGKWLK